MTRFGGRAGKERERGAARDGEVQLEGAKQQDDGRGKGSDEDEQDAEQKGNMDNEGSSKADLRLQ